MKKLLLLPLFFIFVFPVSAHPGRTASDGCHYCRTNCDSWGVPWNQRHCHNGGGSTYNPPAQTAPAVPVEQPAEVIYPTEIIYPTKIIYPTNTPVPTPTSKPTPTPYIETEMDKKKMFLVTKVIDGDTFDISIRGKTERVRLLGIDTPETVDPRKTVQCFGREAFNKMKSLLQGQYVKLIDERAQGNRDKYGRLLRYAYLKDGTFVNVEMVKQGYAFSYRQYPTKYLDLFNQLEKEARENNRGLWNSCPINNQ